MKTPFLLNLILVFFFTSLITNAQEICGWVDLGESIFTETPESALCGNGIDDFIPVASDSILTVRVVLVISQDQNGDSPFSDNLAQDSTDFLFALNTLNAVCFDQIPAPSVANPNPTVTVTDTRIRFVLKRVLYRQATGNGSNVTNWTEVVDGLPEHIPNNYLVINYTRAAYASSTPKAFPWGQSHSAWFINMWEHNSFNAYSLLAHEIGHCFGLQHTFLTDSWGDWDRINDTPLDIHAVSAIACAPAAASCACPPQTPYPGNVCPDNYMGYNQQRWWSPRQIAIMRKMLLLRLPQLIQSNLTAAPTAFKDINSPTVWDGERIVYRNIRVKSGASLTINGTALFGKDAIIEVESGAELITDCAYLSAAGNYFWGGIRLLGDNTEPQTLQYQSKLTMSRSVVNRATDAVMNGGIFSCAAVPSGGIIHVTDCSFENNLRDVALVKYDPSAAYGSWVADWIDYKAEFYNTVFVKNHHFTNLDNLYRGAAVSLWGVHGVVFEDCEVRQQKEYRDLATFPNEGIYMLDASLKMTKGRVEGFRYGIRSFSTKSSLIGSHISQVRFNHNRYGAYLGGGQLHQVMGNLFFIASDVPGSPGTDGSVDLPYGVYFNTAGLFRAEENRFFKFPSVWDDYSQDPAATNVGLAVHNNGGLNNIVYHNTFSNLNKIGIQATGQNRDASGNIGLQCKCNNFNNTTIDIHVRGTLSNSLDGVRNNQGNLVAGTPVQEDMAGNLFTDDSLSGHAWDFLNEWTSNVNYHHHDKLNNPDVEPNPRQNVLPFNYQGLNHNSSSCPLKLMVLPESGDTLMEVDYPFAVADVDFEEYGNRADSTRLLLKDLVDGGNTWELQAEIYFTPQHEYYDMYLDLMNEAPYLSDEVLSNLIQLSEFDEMMLRNILVAHPQASKNEDLMEELSSYHPDMPQYMVDDIMAGQDQFGTKEVMEGALSLYRLKQFAAAHRLLEFYTSDPAYQSESLIEVRNLLGQLPFPAFQYMRVQMELDLGNTEQAQTVLDAVPILCGLNDEEMARHAEFSDYFDLQINMIDNGDSWCSLDEPELNDLQTMSGAGHAAGEWARGVLALHEVNVGYREPLFIPSAQPGKKEGSRNHPQLERPSARIYPNPSSGMLTVDLGEVIPGEKLMLTVYDLNGKPLKRIELIGSVQLIDLRHLSRGAYVVSVYNGPNRIFEDKLLLFD